MKRSKLLLWFIELILVWSKVYRRIMMLIYKCRFASCGKSVWFDPKDQFTYENISLGNCVFIAPGAVFSCPKTNITIGNKVMFGPNVMIMGGDHNYRVIGQYMYDVKEDGVNLPVVIGDDVWIGAGAIILKGVTIGRGSVIGAGSVITKSIPNYSIALGNPARVVRQRFNPEEVIEHERNAKLRNADSKFLKNHD